MRLRVGLNPGPDIVAKRVEEIVQDRRVPGHQKRVSLRANQRGSGRVTRRRESHRQIMSCLKVRSCPWSVLFFSSKSEVSESKFGVDQGHLWYGIMGSRHFYMQILTVT